MRSDTQAFLELTLSFLSSPTTSGDPRPGPAGRHTDLAGRCAPRHNMPPGVSRERIHVPLPHCSRDSWRAEASSQGMWSPAQSWAPSARAPSSRLKHDHHPESCHHGFRKWTQSPQEGPASVLCGGLLGRGGDWAGRVAGQETGAWGCEQP